MKTVAFIPARGGSKGLPGKNIRDCAGHPLLAYSIKSALECDLIDHVFVSTDCPKIAAVAKDYGSRVLMRPDILASDTALPKDAILYHLAAMDEASDLIVLLQPTSPLRTSEDISACVQPIIDDVADSVATFVSSPSSPYRAWKKSEKDGLLAPFVDGHDMWLPRQKLEPTYHLNGAVYAVRSTSFLDDPSSGFLPGRKKMVLMTAERSLDIDTISDFEKVEKIIANSAQLQILA